MTMIWVSSLPPTSMHHSFMCDGDNDMGKHFAPHLDASFLICDDNNNMDSSCVSTVSGLYAVALFVLCDDHDMGKTCMSVLREQMFMQLHFLACVMTTVLVRAA